MSFDVRFLPDGRFAGHARDYLRTVTLGDPPYDSAADGPEVEAINRLLPLLPRLRRARWLTARRYRTRAFRCTMCGKTWTVGQNLTSPKES